MYYIITSVLFISAIIMDIEFAYNTLSVVESSHGGILAIYQGHEYMKAYEGVHHIDMRCKYDKENKCRARIQISRSAPYTLIRGPNHEHEEIGKCEGEIHADAAYRCMLQMALETSQKPSYIYATILSELPEPFRYFMKTKKNCTAAISRIRRAHRIPEPTAVGPCIEGDMRKTNDGEDWVLYENPVEKMVVFSSNTMMQHMSDAEVLLMDGMHEVPESTGYYQLYTLHARVGAVTIPVVYALLPKKDRATYDKLFDVILAAFDERNMARPNPDAVVIDFELAAVLALEDYFPDARITGCFFHLNKSIKKWVDSEIGRQATYDSDFKVLMTSLVYLAFLRIEDIPSVWEALDKKARGPAKQLSEYFGEFYAFGVKKNPTRYKKATGYKPPRFRHCIWNLHDAALSEEPTTNNFAESWHNSIKILLKETDMTLSSYVKTLKQDYVTRKVRLDNIRLGREIPRPDSKMVKKMEKIRGILNKYETKTPMAILKEIVANVKK